MPKSSNRFILSNEDLNEAGFRVITSGIDLSYFKSNPQLYWLLDVQGMKTQSTALIKSYWDDIRVNNNEISAVPFFYDDDPLAIKIYNCVEHGSIRAVNVVFDYIDFDDNISNWKSGQKQAAVTKAILRYASLSVGQSVEGSEMINLHATSNIICLKRHNHTESFSLNTPIKNMDTPKIPNLHPMDELTPEIRAILINSIEAGKFTTDIINQWVTLIINDKSVIAAVKNVVKNTPIKPELIEGKYHHAYIEKAAEQTYDQISNNGDVQLRDMKKGAPELYKAKFFEKFGRLPADVA